jgi:hypothetical protein
VPEGVGSVNWNSSTEYVYPNEREAPYDVGQA